MLPPWRCCRQSRRRRPTLSRPTSPVGNKPSRLPAVRIVVRASWFGSGKFWLPERSRRENRSLFARHSQLQVAQAQLRWCHRAGEECTGSGKSSPKGRVHQKTDHRSVPAQPVQPTRSRLIPPSQSLPGQSICKLGRSRSDLVQRGFCCGSITPHSLFLCLGSRNKNLNSLDGVRQR